MGSIMSVNEDDCKKAFGGKISSFYGAGNNVATTYIYTNMYESRLKSS